MVFWTNCAVWKEASYENGFSDTAGHEHGRAVVRVFRLAIGPANLRQGSLGPSLHWDRTC